eukprot:GDKJ01022054.1.p1 GENE.GDKJ01022054.1~~GDKJ01022054.1.p1  ORF type:complete len:963 (+),score=237.76 GDKJ01022054.1:100-2988(+)
MSANTSGRDQSSKLSAFYSTIKESTQSFFKDLPVEKSSGDADSNSSSASKLSLAGELLNKFISQLEAIVGDDSTTSDSNDDASQSDLQTRQLIADMIGKLNLNQKTQTTPSSSLGALAVCPAERRKSHEPDLLTESDLKEDTRELGSVPFEGQSLSAAYIPKRPRSVQNGVPDTPFDANDEYRDDDDPGYRIRDVYEVDLLSELQVKLRRPVLYQSLFNPPVRFASDEQIQQAAMLVQRFSRKCARQERLKQQQLQSSKHSIPPHSDVSKETVVISPLKNLSTADQEHVSSSQRVKNVVEPTQKVGAAPPEKESQQVGSFRVDAQDNTNHVVRSDSPHPSLPDSEPAAANSNVDGSVVKVTEQTAEEEQPSRLSDSQRRKRERVEQNDSVSSSQKPKLLKSPSNNAAAAVPSPAGDTDDDEDMSDFNAEDIEIETLIRAGGGSLSNPTTPGTILDPSTGQCVLVTDTTFRSFQKKVSIAAHAWATEYSGGSQSAHRETKRKNRLIWAEKVKGSLKHPKPSDSNFPLKVQTTKGGIALGYEHLTANEENAEEGIKNTSNEAKNMKNKITTQTLDCFHLKVVFDRDKTGFEDQKDFNPRSGELIAGRYVMLGHLGSAAFSKAVKCLDQWTGLLVCMKIIKNDKEFLDQSLDEIKLLRYINANCDPDESHILRLLDFFYHKEHLIIVTELLRDNLYEYAKFIREHNALAMRNPSTANGGVSPLFPYFTLGRLQKITKQVLQALRFTHSLRLVHCDLKPENILLKRYRNTEVKVIDFGSSCFDDDNLSSYVQSRSYRAPEVILGLPYDSKVDIWSLGCIIAELWSGYVLFQNDSIVSLLARVIGILGPLPSYLLTRGKYVPQYFTQDGQLYYELDEAPCPERGRKVRLLVPKRTTLWQRMRTDDRNFLSFLHDALHVDPARRPSATQLLGHPWLTDTEYPDGLSASERRWLHQMSLKESLSSGIKI